MFNDERINQKVNKIYRRGIIYATITTLVFVVLKIFVIRFDVTLLLPELCVLVAGTLIWLIGIFLHGHPQDEREEEMRNAYYQR